MKRRLKIPVLKFLILAVLSSCFAGPVIGDNTGFVTQLPAAWISSPPAWTPLKSDHAKPNMIVVNDRVYSNLKTAVRNLQGGDKISIGPGVYKEAVIIRADGITLEGLGHVILDGTVAEGKGAIVAKGDDITIRNMECRNIQVRDGNGACVRHEGSNLTIEHVYFHDSQEGILTGKQPGLVKIRDSRFENLGHGGRAHGIYIGGGHVVIEDSQFLRSKGEGHEVKSRSLSTRISNCIIASLNGKDSRLIDLPHGGEIVIENSVLQQGANSSNSNLIGVGVEGRLHYKQSLIVRNNIIIMERRGKNLLLDNAGSKIKPVVTGNTVISKEQPQFEDDNIYFPDRESAGIAPYPALPAPMAKP